MAAIPVAPRPFITILRFNMASFPLHCAADALRSDGLPIVQNAERWTES
jgi:hypothetical protein